MGKPNARTVPTVFLFGTSEMLNAGILLGMDNLINRFNDPLIQAFPFC